MHSADTTMELARSTRASAYLDWAQMLSGAVLILFMWAHMILVASVIISPKVMNAIAWFFEATYMAQIGGPVIALIFLFHFVLAARKAPFRAREQKTFWKHSRQMKHTDTWLWLVQVVTAMIILIMGITHMWVVLTDLPITAAKSAERIQNGWWLAFYLVLLPMVELHVSVGFYRIGVKWGFIRRDNRPKMKKVEKYLIITFIAIGLLALLRFSFLAV